MAREWVRGPGRLWVLGSWEGAGVGGRGVVSGGGDGLDTSCKEIGHGEVEDTCGIEAALVGTGEVVRDGWGLLLVRGGRGGGVMRDVGLGVESEKIGCDEMRRRGGGPSKRWVGGG